MLRRPVMAAPAHRLALLVRPCLAVVEVILGLRFVFRALASQDTGVVWFVSTITGPLANPWRGIVSDTLDGSRVLEWSTLIAMAVYAVAAAFFVRMLRSTARL